MENLPNENELSPHHKSQLEQIKKDTEQKSIWRKNIAENHALQDYLKQFTPDSVQRFVEHLLTYKGFWVNYGPNYLENMNTEGIEWVQQAEEHLKIILQKKLFDLQCLWRAEQITIPQIQLSSEFSLWESNLLNCPFIEPVTEEEIEMYCQYLLSSNEGLSGWIDEFHDYDDLKLAYNSDDSEINFPDWYDFHNGKTGKGVLMTLPDVRGQKEEHYHVIYRDANKEKWAARQKEYDEKRDKTKSLNYYEHGFMDWYVSTFENKEVQQLYKAYQWSDKSDNVKESMERDLDLLFEAGEMVPIAANSNWMEAVKEAAAKYRAKKTAEALPEAWEQYMINIQTGIAFPTDSDFESFYEDCKRAHTKGIIEGRILAGEPGDLNF